MDNEQIAERIKLSAKKSGISISKMLSDCKIGKNTIAKIASGSSVTSDTISKIADYLNVSLDYLLGRTSTPQEIINENFSTVSDKKSRITIIRKDGDGQTYREFYINNEDVELIENIISTIEVQQNASCTEENK